uniref:Uncharacterized protein n=1 Tax=Chinchilla lanigera TaxID=34839 RepID=A0A8C2VLJ8_CHILA
MKGTLLVLALLLTTDLGFQTAKGCPAFYDVFTKLALGLREPLFAALDVVSATEAEKVAFGKIQDCYNEGGLKAKTLDATALTW